MTYIKIFVSKFLHVYLFNATDIKGKVGSGLRGRDWVGHPQASTKQKRI